MKNPNIYKKDRFYSFVLEIIGFFGKLKLKSSFAESFWIFLGPSDSYPYYFYGLNKYPSM